MDATSGVDRDGSMDDGHDEVWARKWELDFAEVSGRATPPDRVAAILSRSRQQSGPPAPRVGAVWSAALVVLAVAVTVAVSVLRGDPSPDGVPVAAVGGSTESDPAVADPQDKKSKPKPAADQTARQSGDPGKDAGAGKTESEDKGTEKGTEKDAEKDAAKAEAKADAKGQEAVADPAQVRALQQRQFENLLARLAAQQAAQRKAQRVVKVDAPVLSGPVRADPKDLTNQAADGLGKVIAADPRGVAEQRALEQLVAKIRRSQTGERLRRNPLLQGDYLTALKQLSDLRSRLDLIYDPAQARQVLDQMTQRLADARRALWAAEENRGKTAPPAPPSRARRDPGTGGNGDARR